MKPYSGRFVIIFDEAVPISYWDGAGWSLEYRHAHVFGSYETAARKAARIKGLVRPALRRGPGLPVQMKLGGVP